MARYDLSRDDLKEIYYHLLAAGLGQWVKGHYAALSSIAYVEPLVFYAESKGLPIRQTAFTLLKYWEGRIPQGHLLRSVAQ